MRVSAPQPDSALWRGAARAIGAFKAAWARGPFPGSAGFCCLTSPEPYALSNLVISIWHRVDTERSAVPGPGPPGSGPLLALEQQQEFWPVFPAQSLMLHSKLAGGRARSPHLDLRARLCFLLPRVSLCNPRSEKTRGCEVRKRRPRLPCGAARFPLCAQGRAAHVPSGCRRSLATPEASPEADVRNPRKALVRL